MRKDERLMRLQVFAESEVPGGEPKDSASQGEAGSRPAEKGEPEPKPAEDKKYTDDDVDKIINRKFAEWEKKQQQKVDEAKRLAEMNAQQKAEYEREQMEKRLNELLRKDALAEMSKAARGMLSEKGINVGDELLEMLVSEDADRTKAAVDTFISLFQETVKKAVGEALKGSVPKTGTAASGLTKEQILNVKNRSERQRLIRDNMHLFQ